MLGKKKLYAFSENKFPWLAVCIQGKKVWHLSVDVLALGSMKTAARRDIQWELQKHETHQVVERIGGLGSPMPTSC